MTAQGIYQLTVTDGEDAPAAIGHAVLAVTRVEPGALVLVTVVAA